MHWKRPVKNLSELKARVEELRTRGLWCIRHSQSAAGGVETPMGSIFPERNGTE